MARMPFLRCIDAALTCHVSQAPEGGDLSGTSSNIFTNEYINLTYLLSNIHAAIQLGGFRKSLSFKAPG
jgi:hypothetical protein